MSEEQTAIDSPPSTVEGSVETVTTIDSPSTTASTIAATAEEHPQLEKKPTPLPSLKDLPSLGSNAAFANVKVSWGPNMKPAVSNSPSPSPSAPSLTTGLGAKRMRSKNIQEAFTLDLQSQLSITKPELSRIVQSVKKNHDVSVESTLSKNARTFLVSGVAANVHEAKRELVKKLTKPINAVIEVPSKCKASIIGSGGRTIREISDAYEVKINVSKEVNENSYDEDMDDTTSNVSLFGDFESVNLAKAKILAIVKEETKNATIKLVVEDEKYLPYIDVSEFASDEGDEEVKVQFYKKSGDIVISGPREKAKATKTSIQDYLKKLASNLDEEKVKIPSKFQFLIDAEELKEKYNVIVTFPSTPDDELVSFVGLRDKVGEAITYARSSSKSYVVESLDISKAHSKNLTHAKNLIMYFTKYSVLKGLEESHPNVKISLPSIQSLPTAETVTIHISAKSDEANDIKAVRKELISFVNNIPPSETLVITDLDYELFGGSIKHCLLASESSVAFVQFGDYYPNDNSILLVALTEDEDFKPSIEEIQASLNKANESLNSLRTKQNNMETKTYEFSEEVQDSLFKPSSATWKLIMEDISEQEGHLQIKLHTPEENQLTVRGDEKAATAANKIFESILNSPSSKSKMTVNIPANSVARLIGNKGSNLQQIREKFACQIDIPNEENNNASKDKTVEVTLTGLEYNLTHAKKYLAAEAKKWSDIITKELIVPVKFHGSLIGPHGTYRNRLQEKYNVFINFPRDNEIVTIRGPSRGVNKAHEELKALLDFEMENGHKMVINVPAEHVPRIIGKNGDNINDIRAEYGVEMDFLQKSTDPKAQETGEVELEITGSRQNIKDAAKRVESIVAEASDFVTEVLKIDHKYHKSIVGSGGHILRDIISKAGGEEIRNKSVDIPNADSENKDITVQGPQKFVKKVVEEINKIVKDAENSVTKTIDIPAERKGALIGPGGVVRRQLESEFNINLFVPNKDDPSGKITITGAPENVEKAEKKILNEIIRENFDREVDVPASIYEYVSERGAFIQKLRMDLSVNVRFGNTSKKANKLARAPIEIPLEKVRGSTEGENAEKTKFTIEEVGEPTSSEEGDITMRLTYEPIDLSSILSDGEEKEVTKDTSNDSAKKEEALDTAVKLIKERIAKAPSATYAGYVWSADTRRFNMIVGPGGSNIKKIREAADVIINVPRKSDKVNDVVYIRGTKAGVEKAGEMVLKSLRR
ncbi:ASN_HP2_G0027870.mRNA.1.CDS.1 [Saccharomyces cerevisiae]|nr:ASN_HP2_G0027870.mRNA.1.CDS.1 [Saccharomyces cerevisiae]CAI6803383.1 ASN_HP2_G0027870.mRNA.1.CDS.1 [Saccharomyces cerevisiae]CAI6812924.1 ASN_HP1_G0028750.mRNA.1.CDS.1 [Saccharomyces cerevisiae]